VQLSTAGPSPRHNGLPVKPTTLTTVTLPDTVTAERQAATRRKPPNILIYCGKKNASRQFASVKRILSEVGE